MIETTEKALRRFLYRKRDGFESDTWVTRIRTQLRFGVVRRHGCLFCGPDFEMKLDDGMPRKYREAFEVLLRLEQYEELSEGRRLLAFLGLHREELETSLPIVNSLLFKRFLFPAAFFPEVAEPSH